MFSNGLRSHGIIEESEEIRMDKESIVLGSGDLYCTDFQGTNEAIPDDTVIETEDNRLGHIKGGAEIDKTAPAKQTCWKPFIIAPLDAHTAQD